MKKIFILLPILILIILSACGGESDKPNTKKATVPKAAKKPIGYMIYKQHCLLCHGAKGNMGLNGSHDLTASKLTLEESIEVIKNGRNTMMPYKATLSETEIKDVATYIGTLKK